MVSTFSCCVDPELLGVAHDIQDLTITPDGRVQCRCLICSDFRVAQPPCPQIENSSTQLASGRRLNPDLAQSCAEDEINDSSEFHPSEILQSEVYTIAEKGTKRKRDPDDVDGSEYPYSETDNPFSFLTCNHADDVPVDAPPEDFEECSQPLNHYFYVNHETGQTPGTNRYEKRASKRVARIDPWYMKQSQPTSLVLPLPNSPPWDIEFDSIGTSEPNLEAALGANLSNAIEDEPISEEFAPLLEWLISIRQSEEDIEEAEKWQKEELIADAQWEEFVPVGDFTNWDDEQQLFLEQEQHLQRVDQIEDAYADLIEL